MTAASELWDIVVSLGVVMGHPCGFRGTLQASDGVHHVEAGWHSDS